MDNRSLKSHEPHLIISNKGNVEHSVSNQKSIIM